MNSKLVGAVCRPDVVARSTYMCKLKVAMRQCLVEFD